MSNAKEKRSISPEKETEFSQKLTFFYERISKCFLCASILCLGVTIFFDLIPTPYYAWAEVLFCRDFTLLISTSVVIWAFGASLLIYFMGRMDTRCFGIRLYEVLLVNEGRASLAWKLLTFMGEMFLMGCCGVYGWSITLFAISLLQLLNIVYILLIIIQETPPNRVIDSTYGQTEDLFTRLAKVRTDPERHRNSFYALAEKIEEERANWLLMKALRGINYHQHEDIHALSDCLPAGVWKPLDACQDAQLLVSWKLACCILDEGQDCAAGDVRLPFALTSLLREILKEDLYPFFVKEGFLAALLVRANDPAMNQLFPDLLSNIKDGYGMAVDWNVHLLRPLVDSDILPEKRRLLHELEAIGDDDGCKPFHILPEPEEKLLADFLVYLGYELTPEADLPEMDPPEMDPPEKDPPETDLPEIGPPEMDPPEKGSPETDLPEMDPPEMDPPEKDPPETDLPEMDPPEKDPPETDLPEMDPPEKGPPETDQPEMDPPEMDPPEKDPPETDLPEMDPPEKNLPETDLPEVDPPEKDLPEKDPPEMPSYSEGEPINV